MGLANSLALKIAGVTKETEDPIGGTVVRNSDGGNISLIIPCQNACYILELLMIYQIFLLIFKQVSFQCAQSKLLLQQEWLLDTAQTASHNLKEK